MSSLCESNFNRYCEGFEFEALGLEAAVEELKQRIKELEEYIEQLEDENLELARELNGWC